MEQNFKKLKKKIFEENKSKHQRLSNLTRRTTSHAPNEQTKLKMQLLRHQEQVNWKRQ